MSIRVLITDDHQIMREGLRALLEKDPYIKVVGEAENGRTALRLIRDLAPQVILMDVAMPDMNGIEATRQIVSEFPNIKVIALSMHDDKRFVLNMLKAGASGYLLKDCASKEVAQAVHGVMANKTFLSPGVAYIVVKELMTSATPVTSSVFLLLSDRECEVLKLIAEGKTVKQTADYLHLSMKAIDNYRAQIMQKLKIKTIAELTKFAIREGLATV
jgi:two-component system response regulator NreC